MRNSLLFLLLASAAMPAVAAPGDDGDREARREARAEARAERQAERQAERAQQPQESAPQARARSPEPRHENRPAVHQQQAEIVREGGQGFRSRRGSGDSGRPALERRIVRSEQSFGTESPGSTMERQRDTAASVREWRGRERSVGNSPAEIEQHNGTLDGGSFRELRREPRGRDAIGNRRGPVVGSIPREGAQPPLPASTRQSRTNRWSNVTAQHWRSHWRSDRRYDWRNHRRRHGSLFSFGFYYDPFGWNYRRYSIGSRLWPSYYRSSYWLNDPWQYRLPYAPPGYRWIRYHHDAILVDTWDGQVVDVIYNFFW